MKMLMKKYAVVRKIEKVVVSGSRVQSSTITAFFPSSFMATIYKSSLLYLALAVSFFLLLFFFPSLFPPSPHYLPSPSLPTSAIYAYNMPVQHVPSCRPTGFATYDVMLGLYITMPSSEL